MGRVLRARGYRVLESFQGFADRVGHGDVDVIARVIPFDGKPAGFASRWVDSDAVFSPESIEEVGGVLGGNKFDSKVINSKGECGRQGGVGPNTRGVCHRSVGFVVDEHLCLLDGVGGG